MRRTMLVIWSIAAFAPLAQANGPRDCLDDPFYRLQQASGEYVHCRLYSSAEREAATKQRGAEPSIDSERATDGAARGRIEWERETEKWKNLGNTYTN